MRQADEIVNLINLFAKLPGLGQRSARRIVLHLLEDPKIRISSIITLLSNVKNNIKTCSICHNLSFQKLCEICVDEKRDKTTIAVIETISELWAIEKTGIFKGKYHIIGNITNISNNYNEPIELKQLLSRCEEDKVQELIIATNSTIEGQTAAFLILDFFKQNSINNMKITRLASGIPIGGELDYLDEGTLLSALNLRQNFDQK